MLRKRGKSKRGPTYYNFTTWRLRLGPSSSPIVPPSTGPILIDSPSLDSPLIDQNWRRNDNNPIFIEEEFPLVPPQSPPDS
jgi:hypothetical protein